MAKFGAKRSVAIGSDYRASDPIRILIITLSESCANPPSHKAQRPESVPNPRERQPPPGAKRNRSKPNAGARLLTNPVPNPPPSTNPTKSKPARGVTESLIVPGGLGTHWMVGTRPDGCTSRSTAGSAAASRAPPAPHAALPLGSPSPSTVGSAPAAEAIARTAAVGREGRCGAELGGKRFERGRGFIWREGGGFGRLGVRAAALVGLGCGLGRPLGFGFGWARGHEVGTRRRKAARVSLDL